MSALRRFTTRLLNLTANRGNRDRICEEMESHVASQAEDFIRSGMAPAEARRQARIKFGSPDATQEACHAEDSLHFLDNLAQDVRYSFRVLRKSPAFTLVALLTLMLGIGANVAVFGVLNAILLRPLAVTDPQNLYQIRHQQWATGRLLTTSYPAFEDLRRRNSTFSGMAGIYAYAQAAMSWRNTARSIAGDQVTGNYFDLLGVQPALGRFFHEADEHGPDSAPYLVVSNDLWRTAFQADPNVIGTTVLLNKHPFTVVGVAPQTFHGTERFVWPDFWMPMINQQQVSGWDYLHTRSSVAVTVLGRLKSGVTPRQAMENLAAITAQLAREFPQTDDPHPLRLIHPGLYGDEADVIRGFLLGVTALALLVLAAACANLASLFAARAADRSRELALRMALGSTRARLVRQLLTEAVMLSFAGGAAGLVTACLLLQALNRWHPSLAHLEIGVDARVCVGSLALTLVSALLFGMLPARMVWRSSPMQSMKGGRTESLHLRRFALRDLLLGLQIAICTLLVTASLVAVRGMVRVLHAPVGIQPQGALLANLDFSQDALSADAALIRQQAILDAIRTLPGVSAAGAVNRTPMTGGLHGIPVYRPGTTEFKLDNAVLSPYVFSISPGYLEAAGTHLLTGRDVTPQDTSASPYVAIVNQTFARRMGDQPHAVGQRFLLNGKLTEVIGVAEDGKYHDITEPPQPALYVPYSQGNASDAVFVVRSPRAPLEMATTLRSTLSAFEPDTPLTVQAWSDSLQPELFPARAATAALGIMGLLASLLAVTGIFGTAAYSVSRRRKELGIRVALGARKTQVLASALGRPMLLLAAGSALGLLAGIPANRLLRQIVYQANPADPLVVLGAVVTMTLLGMLASALPARRALAIDPSRLLREE